MRSRRLPSVYRPSESSALLPKWRTCLHVPRLHGDEGHRWCAYPSPSDVLFHRSGNYFGNDATNNYEAIQVKVEKRFSQGLQFLGHYTYSHANAYDSNYYAADKKFAYGPDPFSRNHVFVVSTVYELPFGRGKKFMSDAGRAMDLLIGGWQCQQYRELERRPTLDSQHRRMRKHLRRGTLPSGSSQRRVLQGWATARQWRSCMSLFRFRR